MESLLWIGIAAVAIAFGYTMNMHSATLAYGRELAGSESGSGYQAAITPPWATSIAAAVYLAIPAITIVTWWRAGGWSGLGALVLILLGAGLARAALPKPASPHYRQLIIRSMCVRYAHYARDGDVVRADAMRQLLALAGMDHIVGPTSIQADAT